MAYAVIDFETTGVMPERGDRVAEVGIVLTDDAGRIEFEWTTLVNPQRDVGASHIHGLRARDLIDAPTFSDVADDILELLAGRTVTAHNAVFDMRFLHLELTRAGYPIERRPDALCTMRWSGRLIGPAKLEQCCEALGIPLLDAHNALNDARATAQLLPHLLNMCTTTGDWDYDADTSRNFMWPATTGRTGLTALRQRSDVAVARDAWLDSVLSAAWIPGVPADEASYLLVLDRALIDRKISFTEGRELAEAALTSGLDGTTVARLHRDYLRSVAIEALADEVVTPEEYADLTTIATTLRLTAADVDAALAWARDNSASTSISVGFRLNPDDRIVFTGATKQPRDEWVSRIVAAGLTSGGVTKSTKALVAADPDSMSGKAAKARKYGVPVIDEDTFARYFDIYRRG